MGWEESLSTTATQISELLYIVLRTPSIPVNGLV
jgi:hypothetical protein